MTQDAGPRIDPRFDPRFQRGYDGAPTPAERSDPVSASASESASAPTAGAAAEDAPVVDAAASAVDRRVADVGESAPETISTSAKVPTDAPARAPAEPLEPTRLGAAARLWIALAVSVGFIVVGSGVLWTLVSDRDFFIGRAGSAEEQAVLQFAINLTPGVVQAGVAGVLAVLVVWATRGRGGGTRAGGAR